MKIPARALLGSSYKLILVFTLVFNPPNSFPHIDNPFFLTTMRLLPDQTIADSFTTHSHSPKPVVGTVKLTGT
jgi:hypothetical protein